MITTHLRGVSALPELRKSRMMSVIEANYGGWTSSNRMAAVLESSELPMAHYRQPNAARDHIGIWTKDKADLAITTETRLLNNQVVFRDQLVTNQGSPETARAKLLNQLRGYRQYVKAPADPTAPSARTRKVYTGKASGPDDECIVLQLACLYAYRIEGEVGRYDTC